jgi:hypothetical protein
MAKDLKTIPCKFQCSLEGCTKTELTCKYSHEPACNHIGCIMRGTTLTHLAKNCGFIKDKKPVEPVAPAAVPVQDPKTVLLEQIYDKIIKKLAGKFTGMYSQAFDIPDLQKILDDPKEFEDNLKLACETIIAN